MTNAVAKYLIPVDGSEPAERAVRYVIDAIAAGQRAEVHILNVQAPVRGDVSAFVGKDVVKDYHREEAEKCLAGAKKLLQAAGIDFKAHIGLGEPGHTVAAFAKELGITQVVMGTRGLGSALGMLMGSVATHVVRDVNVPVTLIK